MAGWKESPLIPALSSFIGESKTKPITIQCIHFLWGSLFIYFIPSLKIHTHDMFALICISIFTMLLIWCVFLLFAWCYTWRWLHSLQGKFKYMCVVSIHHPEFSTLSLCRQCHCSAENCCNFSYRQPATKRSRVSVSEWWDEATISRIEYDGWIMRAEIDLRG